MKDLRERIVEGNQFPGGGTRRQPQGPDGVLSAIILPQLKRPFPRRGQEIQAENCLVAVSLAGSNSPARLPIQAQINRVLDAPIGLGKARAGSLDRHPHGIAPGVKTQGRGGHLLEGRAPDHLPPIIQKTDHHSGQTRF